VDLSQCAEEMGLTARKWSTGETCTFIFFVYSLSALTQNALFCIFLIRGV